jgi:hypothetical protein
MWSDNKVHKLATMCLPWQQWTETSVWFDDVGMSLSGVCYFLSVFWCAVARMLELQLNFLLKLARGEAKSERC